MRVITRSLYVGEGRHEEVTCPEEEENGTWELPTGWLTTNGGKK